MKVTMLDNGPGESYGMGSGLVAQCCSYSVNTRRCVEKGKEEENCEEGMECFFIYIC